MTNIAIVIKTFLRIQFTWNLNHPNEFQSVIYPKDGSMKIFDLQYSTISLQDYCITIDKHIYFSGLNEQLYLKYFKCLQAIDPLTFRQVTPLVISDLSKLLRRPLQRKELINFWNFLTFFYHQPFLLRYVTLKYLLNPLIFSTMRSEGARVCQYAWLTYGDKSALWRIESCVAKRLIVSEAGVFDPCISIESDLSVTCVL